MTVKHKGAAFELGGKEYVFEPLTIGSFERLEDQISGITAGTINDFQLARSIILIATESLKRNYPEITKEEVAELIDLTNMQDIFSAVMQTSNPRANDTTNPANNGGTEEEKK